MNYKLLNRIIAAIVFVISTVVLFLTVQPSVSFWDCGEFIASGFSLQVPHPPGAPFFLLLGRVFAMLPFADNMAFRFNIISVLSSSLSILFLYLIAVKLIENFKGKVYQNFSDALLTYIPAAIGALSFSFSDTFWFNGGEAEVYAASTLIFAAVTYLMIVWHERADSKDNEKYILFIAYLIGLSTGIHLMSVLAMISVVMIITFRKYVDDDEALKKTGYIFLAHAGLLTILAIALWANQTDATPPTPDQYKEYDSRFKMVMAGISILVVGALWKKLIHRNSFYVALAIGGAALFAVYPGIVKIIPGLMASISGDNITTQMILVLLLLGGLSSGVYYAVKNNKPTMHLIFMSMIFAFLGFSTYTLVIVRANQNPPMNENEPDNFTELVSYLNREQYGDFPTFKRRFATEPHQMGVYENYSSDLDFWWRYQMNHMTTRYFMWNYVGRESWVQDAGANMWPLNGLGNALFKPFNIHFNGEAKDSLFGIPLLLGLLGIYFHFKKDWKMASIFMVLFIFMGYLTAFYQNQQEPQPRERDYFYVGAFFVFSIWIALGLRGIIDVLLEKIKSPSLAKNAAFAVVVLGIVFVPIRMLQANYFTHDRSRNWVPWDYSYNLLQSCAPNAILFTNGDNDTFPLWYMQDVEGVRRDVRIVNLSLLNTSWYIKQLKNLEPYGARKVSMNMDDLQIDALQPNQWEPQDVTVSVPKQLPSSYKTYAEGRTLLNVDPKLNLDEWEIEDSTVIREGKLTWRMDNSVVYSGIKAVRVQDIMVKEIVQANNWQRPIYFAVTCSDDSKIGLTDYLKMEGMAFRFVPEKKQARVEFINEPVLRKQLIEENKSYSKNYMPGFKFRGLNDSTIFFDENHTRLVQNYRNAFIRLAIYYMNTGQPNQKVVDVLNLMEKKLPRKILPIDYRILYDIGNLYFAVNDLPHYKIIASEIERDALQAVVENPRGQPGRYNPYNILLDIYENLQEYDKGIDLLGKLSNMYPGDNQVKSEIERMRALKANKDSLTIK
ncbi:MAG: DUF2723 domain-containing protein [Ignavibacteriaceae bacterium]|nr:DUF2723 domain-containing protein [Ignavibacteriaceae bacterium]